MNYPVRTPDQLPKILRAFRKRKGLNQAALARRLGITQQAYSELERAPTKASFERLMQIMAALDAEIVLRERPLPTDEPGQW